jgi:hypothetical protein
VVSSPGQALPGSDIEVNFVPHVAVDPADGERVIVMWRRSFQTAGDADCPSRPWMAVSEDGGPTFDQPLTPSSPPSSCAGGPAPARMPELDRRGGPLPG